MEPQVSEETSESKLALSKPIKKREKLESGEVAEEEDGEKQETLIDDLAVAFENKARKELHAFLSNKNIDLAFAENYLIHIRPKKKKHSNGETVNSFSVTYSGPDGSILASKGDVLSSILNSCSRGPSSSVSVDSKASEARRQAHENSKETLHDTLDNLPVVIDGIKLIRFGEIRATSSFHSSVQLYPIGYKAELTLPGVSLSTKAGSGSTMQTLLVEISAVNDKPEFVIVDKTSGQSFVAGSEQAVWKKFESHSGVAEGHSFFNLDIELLLEGLDGALDCSNYLFHVERGYPTAYKNNTQAQAAKSSFLAKSGRERRTQQRQSRVHEVPPDEPATKLDKEQRDKLREERKANESIARKEKQRQKQSEAKLKEQRKEEERIAKEKQKLEEKARLTMKKDVNAELRKARTEASMAVLQVFDQEEEFLGQQQLNLGLLPQRHPNAALYGSSSTISLQEHVESLKDVSESSQFNQTSWDSTIFVANAIHLFKDSLQLQSIDRIDHFLDVLRLFDGGRVCSNTNISGTVQVEPSSLMEIEDLSCAEVKNNDQDLALATHQVNSQQLKEIEEVSSNGLNLGSATTLSDSNGIWNDEATVEPSQASAMKVESKISGEEEWSEDEDRREEIVVSSSNNNCTKASRATNNKFIAPSPEFHAAEADLDRIQLRFLKAFSDDLHELLDLDDKEGGDKKGSVLGGLRIPLNQLTWPEFARMGIVAQMYQDLGKSKDDIQAVLRGSKAPSFRLSKNVARLIRYRMYARSQSQISSSCRRTALLLDENCLQDRLLEFSLSLPKQWTEAMQSTRRESLYSSRVSRHAPDMQNIFTSEAEIASALSELASDVEAPEVYRRAAQVLLKISNTPQAKNFFWEVDSELYPDYYTCIIRPMMLSNVATNLVTRAYGDGDFFVNAEENGLGTLEDDQGSAQSVATEFYSDLRQVFLNCIAYNTEFTPQMAQAHKLLQASARHAGRWLLCPVHLLEIPVCDEQHCLWTGEALLPQYSVKCGRCLGMYSFQGLEDMETERGSFVVVKPTKEQLDQPNEEWFCPLCIREDSLVEDSHDGLLKRTPSPSFIVDEWGPSTGVPWLFNSRHSRTRSYIDENPSASRLIGALQILCDASQSGVLRYQDFCEAVRESENMKFWNAAERIKVLEGLAELAKSSRSSLSAIEFQHAECDKLDKICDKASFREADFMAIVRSIAGNDAVSVCRTLLDGITGDDEANRHQQLTEGRCVVCHASTYEDDLESGDEVILCDGCNAEAHLRCTKLKSVHSGDWHCELCTERIALREAKRDHHFDNIDEYRSKELEEDLLQLQLDRKAGNAPVVDNPGLECAYCGLLESDLCSPLVHGQSREEHEEFLRICNFPQLDGILSPDKKNTSIHFICGGRYANAPKLDVPYFPLVTSRYGKKLMEIKGSQSAGSPSNQLIVHELCALQMFQARMDREKHALRRRRHLVAEKAISMSGSSLRPLGYDNSENEYWRFPGSNDLFVCLGASSDPPTEDHEELDRMLGRNLTSLKAASTVGSHLWKRTSDIAEIQEIIELLGNTKSEQSLRYQLISTFLSNRDSPSKESDSANTDDVESGGTKSEMKEEMEGNADDEMNNGKSDHNEDDHEEDEDEETDNGGISSAGASKMRREALAAAAAKASGLPPPEAIPVALMLFPQKGVEIQRSQVIQQECVFDDNSGEVGPDDDVNHREYFNFGKRYYAIGFINKYGKKVKPLKDYTVIYQIHVEGRDSALAYTPLDEAWSDGIYYFSTISFKKSGKYIVSFIAEGDNASDIKPLAFNINVEAKYVKCGPVCALEKLVANSHIHGPNRQVLAGRKEVMNLINANGYNVVPTELMALKAALLTVFVALPLGSLVMSKAETSDDCFVSSIAEPSGWNSVLEQLWVGVVDSAKTAVEMMESILLLEHYINKSWFSNSTSRLLAALPSPHFAMRCCTLAAAAMRVFVIDRCLLYEKVHIPPREKRSRAESSRPKSSTRRSNENASEDLEPDEETAVPVSGKRQAAAQASSRIRQQTGTREPARSNGRKRISYRDEDSADSSSDEDSEDDALDIRQNLRKRTRISYAEMDEGEYDDASQESSNQFRRGRSSRHGNSGSDEEEGGDEDGGNDNDGEMVEEPLQYEAPSEAEMDCYLLQEATSQSYAKFNFDEAITEVLLDGSLTPSVRDATVRCFSILRKLKADTQTGIFWVPVDIRLVSDYRKVVSEPMDLATVTAMVKSQQFGSDTTSFAKMVRLIWGNCMKYNHPSTIYHQVALRLSAQFEAYYQQWIVSEERPINPDIRTGKN